MLSQILPVGALALLLFLSQGQAAPSLQIRSALPLSKRDNTFVGCDTKQRAKAGQAAADMANLAQWAQSLASTKSPGYSHYFKDDELDKFKIAMSTIAQNNDPTNAPYNFVINCTPTDDVLKECDQAKDGKSYAITDATVPKDAKDHKSIWLCPLFFTGPDTKNDLPKTTDKAALDDWCGKKSYKEFVTAGSTLLHEITHLDAVAKLWGLDADKKTKAHGTDDYVKGKSPIEWARRLKVQIDNQPNRDDVPAPLYNAESYAGAATELWAMKFCNKAFIPPKTGY